MFRSVEKALEFKFLGVGIPTDVIMHLRRMALALSALLLLLVHAAPAAAAAQQGRPPVSPVTLTEVRLLSESSTESRFALTFDPTATTFTPALGPPNQPGLGFASTSRGLHAVQPSGMKGLVRAIVFSQEDTILVVRFQASAAATISAVQTGDKTIEVTVSTGKPPKNYNELSGAAPGTLPPAYEPPYGEEAYELVMLKYADVSEVVGLLTDGITIKSNDVFVPREPAFGSTSLTGNTYQPTPTPTQPGESDEPLGQSVDASMAIDRRLNAIWLKGSPERIARMKQMIAMIDIPVDSVILETQMVELSEQGQKSVGVDFNNVNGQLGVVTFQSGQFIPPGVPAGNHLTSAQFQAAIYAQVQKGNGRIISKPRVAALSGSTAKIITGDALPILTAITLSGVNGVSQQVQYVNVGVTLQIAPRVSADGYVTSHVYAVVSSVTGFQQGYPTISQRQAETSATVRDGDSFVIGGLTQDENTNTKTKVPLLGDIPLLGYAFRSDKNTRSKTELYIIVTPRIVHRVGTMALSTARQEPYDSRPVTTVPAQNPPSEPYYAPPSANIPMGSPLEPGTPPHR
jgi:general secretion pathway protein D